MHICIPYHFKPLILHDGNYCYCIIEIFFINKKEIKGKNLTSVYESLDDERHVYESVVNALERS